MFDYIICHYGEIGLKGDNRQFFEEKLIRNIRDKFNRETSGCFEFIKRISGRLIIKLTDKGKNEQEKIKEILKNIFGIVYFSFALNSKQDIKKISENCLNLLKNKKFKSFRITTKRSQKDFFLTSEEINRQVGAFVLKGLNDSASSPHIKVDLDKPEINCFIEIVEKFAFIYLEKIQGPGGLPVGSSSKALVLLSGGIDSPVASWYAMKRGVGAVYIHFHTLPYTSRASIDKVKRLVKILNKYQNSSKIHLVPFAEIQDKILIKTPSNLRVILYRRFMLRLAQIIAKKEKAIVLITGESVGQVASQTLENISMVEEAVKIPILRPLIGFDKEEIIQKAKQINTYDVSIEPHEDCCVRFLPPHPATKADIKKIKEAEKKIDIKKLINKAVKTASLEIFN